MATLTIFDGSPAPRRAVGAQQCRLADFAERYRGWHTFATDRATRRAIDGLKRRGLIETREHNGFRWRNAS